ncbi:WD40-repeat-containing domain protein [Lentinula raphanica]|nr:WD40-repeat-containing domain protein [Lentinula raphanica]
MGSAASYQRQTILNGPRDAVLSMSFSPDAKFIVATGYSGVHVWEVATSISVPVPEMHYAPDNPKYDFSASSWLFFEQDNLYALILGSMRGDVLVWSWRESNPIFVSMARAEAIRINDQVLSLDVREHIVSNGRSGRIVIATGGGHITAWSLSVKGELTQTFSVALEPGILPRTIRFLKKDIVAFARTGGAVINLDPKTGQVTLKRSSGPAVMGSVSLNSTSDCFVAWTGQNFDMFTFDNLAFVRTFVGRPPLVHFPKHIVFVEAGEKVVGGTDAGHAILYDTRTGKRKQILEYPRGGLVQQVAACDGDAYSYIAIAGSVTGQPAEVILFRRKTSSLYKAARTPRAIDNDTIFVGFQVSRASVAAVLSQIKSTIITLFVLFELLWLGWRYAPVGRYVVPILNQADIPSRFNF